MTDDELIAEFRSRFCEMSEATAMAEVSQPRMFQLIKMSRIKTVPGWWTVLIDRSSLADWMENRKAGRPRKAVSDAPKRPVGRPRKDTIK